ncbi:MAG: phenylalanine--tRNA ligase subunit beta [Magnetococcales bacterium]|nr:phenylalanine--tRNA ligase subunit beta [Magnetococcales bacterium]
MKFSHSWLRQHLDIELSPTAIGDILTMSGLELERLQDLGAGLHGVVVAQLLSVDRHPGADRLTLCQVRVGEETLPVVCGASNHRAGNKVALARVGAVLPGGHPIREAKIRGEVSKGMLCSEVELGLAASAAGVLILPPEAPEGMELAAWLGRKDHVYEVNVTPNRGDCLGVRGIARDLGAVLDKPLLPLESRVRENPAVNDRHPVAVRIDFAKGCPRYTGRVIAGVKVAPSPPWLVQQLELAGIRSINNVVDVTNYVMLELGQPLHAFDLARLAPPIVVRKAAEGEILVTLDEVSRTLSGEMTLIADARRVLALAGIMGGQESGVEENTNDLFLESAFFDPIVTARTGRRLGVLSESRHRFDRGTDPLGLRLALDRATRLIQELAGGEAGVAVEVDAGTWQPAAAIPFRPERANRLGGLSLDQATQSAMLERLGCIKQDRGAEGLFFQPPSHRHDLRQEEDLVEEIVRLYGYDRVPPVLPAGAMATPAPATAVTTIQQKARQLLVGLGYLENVNYAFVSPALATLFDAEAPQTALRLANPLSDEQSLLRTTVVAGLADAARRNISRGNTSLRLFETGRIFRRQERQPREEERLAGLLCGSRLGRNWHTADAPVDFFDLKGDVEALLMALGHEGCRFLPQGPAFLHPGRAATIQSRVGGCTLGWLGELHPAWREKLDVDLPLLLFELDVAALTEGKRISTSPAPSRFQASVRDYALKVPREVAAQSLLDAIQGLAPDLIRKVTLFDLYQGPHLPEGFKGFGVEVVYQAQDRTLTEAETQELGRQMLDHLRQTFAVSLRDG